MSQFDDVTKALEDDGRPAPRTNQHARPTKCGTCDGDRFVTVRLRSPEQTLWMTEHVIKANTREFHEEVAPCPDCNPVTVEYFNHWGPFRSMDPTATRQALAQ